MLCNNWKVLIVLLISGFLMTSCSEDDLTSEADVENFTNQRRQGDNDNRGQNNNNRNQQNVETKEVIIDWMETFLEVERYAEGMRPNASARAIAYINLAAYETVLPTMRGFRSNAEIINGFDLDVSDIPRNIDASLALNESYQAVLSHFLINIPESSRDKIRELYANNNNALQRGLNQQEIESSIQWGQSVAEQVIAFAQSDSEGEQQILDPQPLTYKPPTGDGYWTHSAEPDRALFPYWESVRTFVVSTNETTTIPPIAYNTDPSSAYFAQMMEAYTANNEARDEDGEQLWIAEFWSDDVTGITFSPPARQIAIANQLVDDYNLDYQEALHMYVKLGFSLNDAAVSTWKYKYEHMVMRPNVFIHEYIDPSFQTNLYRLIPWPNPSFPGYPSGHSAFASAAAGVFIDFFGNSTNFTDRSHEGRSEFRSAPRTFSSFEQMAEENAYSRIPLGVHIRMDCDEGIRLGYEISDKINSYSLRRRDS